MGILNFFRRKKEPKEELSSLAVLNDTEPEKMKKEMASFFWKQMPHKKKLFLYTAVNSFIDPIVTTLRSHLTSIGALGAFALFSSAQPTLESIKASKNDEWFNEFELNINDAVIREIRQHPIVEQKAFNADEQYKRAQQLCKYGEDFIFSRMRSFSSCVGMGVAFGTLGLAALAGGPAALAVSAGAAAVSAGMTFFLAPWLGEKRRRITTSQETAINEQAAKITAKQKNQYRNGRMTALHPELGKKENASIKKEKKGILGALKKMYNAVCNVWVQYGAAALVTTAVMACSGFISGPFALAMAVDGVVAGGIILSSVTKFVNAKKDRKISVDMLCKTHNLLKHRSVFDVKTGDKEVNDASRPVIRLENVVHCHRNIKDVPESINGEPNPEFGKRSDKALFASDKTIDIGTGITILGGDSGAGKSTLLSLIMHEDDVTHGSISVGHYDKDGQFVGDDLRELDMGSYMSKIAYQMVNPEWTECSVKEYITGGRDVDPAKLKKICEILDIKEEGPDGLHFDRKIDISDPKFSEGEQKRLAIAQTLLKDTPIMIFDEPTANIGDKMKCALLDYIAQNAADKTVIFISHSPTDLKRLKETMPQQAQFQALHLCAQEKGPACIDQYNLRDSEKWEQYISKISVEEQTRQASASQSEEGKQENISQVQQENKELQQKVEEQQATINQLQKQISQLKELALIGSLYTNMTPYPTAENKSSKTETTSSQPKKNNKFAFHLVKKVSDSACAK